jgi:branched-chain amino acid transport system substrate-binding protein
MTVLLAFTGCKQEAGPEAAGGTAGGGDVIKVGEFASLTGKEAAFGQSSHKGTVLAIDEINAAGGVLGRPFKLLYEDNRSTPGESATIVKKLISREKVVAILGEVASGRSLEAAPICQQNKVPQISPSSTNPKVTEMGDYVFRVCFIDPFQGSVMAKFAGQSLRLNRVAILRDLRSDYSIGLANVFRATFESLGGTISADESYQQGDVDFRAPLTSIIATGPEAIFVPGYYTDVGLIARQARELGLTIPLLGGDGWDSPKLTEIGGKAMEGCYFSNHYATDDQNPVVQDFIANYKAKHNEVPDALAALGYDAARLLVHALKELQKTKPEEFESLGSGGATSGEAKAKRLGALRSLRDILARTREFPGVTGSISLNEKRDAMKPAVVLKIQDQKFSFVERIAP